MGNGQQFGNARRAENWKFPSLGFTWDLGFGAWDFREAEGAWDFREAEATRTLSQKSPYDTFPKSQNPKPKSQVTFK